MDIQKTIDNLKREDFTVSYFETAAEATASIAAGLSGKTIGFGGSQTVTEMGLYDKLAENNTVYSHGVTPGDETIQKARQAEVYISSVNALAETGELINIDGRGNRVSALLYGPKKVIFVVGVNKLAPDLHTALFRARNVAGPLNARRLNKKTPCALGSEIKCYDCSSPDRICRGITITTRKMSGIDEMEVVLINESLGY